MLLAPGGLAQVALDVRDALMRRIADRHGVAVAGLGERDRLAADRVAPITPNLRPGGATVFIPQRYALDDQWALTAKPRAAGEAASD